jgi:hypothetical protein
MNSKHMARMGALIFTAGLMLHNILPAFACGGGPTGLDDPNAPKAVVLAAFAAVNQQTHGNLTPDYTAWDWEKTWFGDSKMECGQAIDHTITHGYQVNIYVYSDDVHYQMYTFDANEDNTVMFQCTATGPGPRIVLNG